MIFSYAVSMVVMSSYALKLNTGNTPKIKAKLTSILGIGIVLAISLMIFSIWYLRSIATRTKFEDNLSIENMVSTSNKVSAVFLALFNVTFEGLLIAIVVDKERSDLSEGASAVINIMLVLNSFVLTLGFVHIWKTWKNPLNIQKEEIQRAYNQGRIEAENKYKSSKKLKNDSELSLFRLE